MPNRRRHVDRCRVGRKTFSRRSFLNTVAAGAVLQIQQGLVPGQTTVARIGSTSERLRLKPYEKRLCRVESYPKCLMPESVYDISVEEYVDLIHSAGIDVQIIAGEMDRGTPRFHSKLLPAHPSVDKDRLPHFIDLAHAKGIIVLSYYPMSYTKPLKEIHPEWLMRFLDDGRPAIDNVGWFCFNSPYRDWLPEYMDEYIERLDVDGIYFDDMNWGSHDEESRHQPACCCQFCAALFQKEVGAAIPTRVDFTSEVFRRFVNWRYEKMTGYMQHIVRSIHRTHPGAIVDFNYYGRHNADWTWAHPINPLGMERVGGYFFIETDPVKDGSSFAAKTARAHGSGFALWTPVMQSLPECTGSSAPYAEPLSPTVHALTALANGGATFFGLFDGAAVLYADAMQSICREVHKREDYFGGDTVKYLLLHYSQQTRDFYSGNLPQYVLQTTKGIYEMLNRSQLLVDIVLDQQLRHERLAQYKVLFLSNSACLSMRQCDEIRSFVSDGGTLIATYETSLFDEFGQQRKSFELADVFGVDYGGRPGDMSVDGIVNVVHDEQLSGVVGPLLCFAGREVRVRTLTRTARVVCTRSNLTGKPPLDNFNPKVAYDSSQPTVVTNSFGRGESIYISGDVGSAYMHNHYPPLKRFVACLARRPRLPFEVHAPHSIETTAVMHGSKQLLIHLLNNPAPLLPFEMSRERAASSFFLEEVLPIHDVTIRFAAYNPKRVRLPLQGRTLEISGNPVSVTVPRIDLHEIVAAEL